jgi:hypothetical protein
MKPIIEATSVAFAVAGFVLLFVAAYINPMIGTTKPNATIVPATALLVSISSFFFSVYFPQDVQNSSSLFSFAPQCLQNNCMSMFVFEPHLGQDTKLSGISELQFLQIISIFSLKTY